MTRKTISDAIGNISDRHIEEVMDHKGKRSSNFWMKFGSIAACLCLCAMLCLGVWQSGIFGKALPDPDTDKTGGVVDGVGGKDNSHDITFSNTAVKTRGKAFTDDEIQNYLNENSEFIVSAIQKEYSFSIDSISVYKKGFYHVSLDDNTVILDAVTLPILVNGKVYAVVDMVRTEDGIVKTLGLGGNKWISYNKVLFDNPKTEVVFAYLPEACGEIMMFPDNTFVNPVAGAVKSSMEAFGENRNWYDLLKTDYNTLSANDLMSAENTVCIYKK